MEAESDRRLRPRGGRGTGDFVFWLIISFAEPDCVTRDCAPPT